MVIRNTTEKRKITKSDIIDQVDLILAEGWGRVEVVIGEKRIVEINVSKKIRE